MLAMSCFHPCCRNITLFLLLLLLITFAAMAAKEEDNVSSSKTAVTPVIGILSQPYYRNGTQEFWIPASYVKWVESAGARVLPIPYSASPESALDIFHQVNGVLFPGGGSPLPESAKIIYKLAMESNSNLSDFFPIWGTCLGFEYLIQLASSDNVLQSGFQAENVSFPLIMWPKSKTRLYENENIQRIATTHAVAMNNHHQGVEPEAFLQDKGLTDMFTMTSVNRDVRGRSFVSTIEPRDPNKFPFYGVQFHPEKNAFEYNTWPGTNIPYEAIPHSSDAIQFSLHLAKFFVDLTRKNMISGREKHEYTKPLQYPLVQTYEVKHDVKFEQVYVIPNDDNGDEGEGDTAVGSSQGLLLRHGAKVD